MIKDNIDATIKPGEDFYGYACGGWQKSHPLKGEYSRYGVFDDIAEKNLQQVKDLIENLGEHPDASKPGTIAQKVNDIYRAGLDMDRRNELGAAPIMPIVERIEKMGPEDFTATMAWLNRGAGGGFFGFGVGSDPADSNMNILHVSECGLTLGDRDYYLEKNETNDRILDAYHKYVKRIMTLVGYSDEDAERVWQSVISIETDIATHKKTREERRNPLLSHNWITIDDFCTKYPAIDWKGIFEGSGLKIPQGLNVSSVKFMDFINSYIPSLDIRRIKDYLIFTAVCEGTGTLSDDFYEADFEMFGRVMSGTEEKKPLWKRAMAIPNSMFGEAIGQLYVEKYFPERNKAYMKGLVENLRKALGKHIRECSWMSDATKEKALDKLASLKVKIGYPDKWKDYSGINIDPEKNYLENVLAASEWYVRDNYDKLGKPVDKDEWFMTPQTVNAYYSPVMNEICFPAGILQAPYFDIDADDAQNYGAIGVVIGHEMTHGFDDQGRRFDKEGNLVDWWTADDESRFNTLADRLVEQFDSVEVAPGVHANGRYTLGENIADQGGLRLAYTAYKIAAGDKPADDTQKEFTPDQLFYLAYASVWASNIRPEEILVRTKSDPHSLGRNRVNVTLRNLQPFFDAFDITEGQPMFRPVDDRVIIW
ncbi:MAG: M13 family metallopeptidase [Bacteroidales bacterium]|nr:M13 family metallopeptidase [Bacteroidales bacterium]